MNKAVLGFVLAFCFAPAAASAAPGFMGAVDVGFSTASALGVKADDWSGGLHALYSFHRPGFNVQADGGYSHIDATGGVNLWNGDLNGFWRDRKGVIGLSIGHGTASNGIGSTNVTSYGAFAEWFAADDFTMRFKGGGFSGGIDGYYGSAAAELYATDDFGVTLNYSYVNINGGFHIHNVGGEAEVLVSEDYPVSVAVGYEHTGYKNANAFLARLRYRFNLDGTLVNVDRKGPVSWNGLAPF